MVKQILLTIPIQEFEEIIRSCVRIELQKNKVEPQKVDTDYIGAKQAAALLKISQPTFIKYVRASWIKRYRIGYTYRYKRSEIEQAMQPLLSMKHSRTQTTY